MLNICMEYAALFESAEEGGFVITIPDFGWGVSQGDTEEEARAMATALLQTLIKEHIRRGEALPRPTRPRGKKYRLIRCVARGQGPKRPSRHSGNGSLSTSETQPNAPFRSTPELKISGNSS